MDTGRIRVIEPGSPENDPEAIAFYRDRWESRVWSYYYDEMLPTIDALKAARAGRV